jgi:hypothetical protein
MALYGTSRDVSLIRHLNRELLHDIISQQCVFYQLQAAETKVNIYGESAGAKYYKEPVILNMLLNLGDISSPTGDMGVDYDLPITFKFFRDDLIDANILPKIGDIVMWYEGYWELDNIADNQLFVGKDPDYPYNINPLNPGLDNFGTSISLTCTAHYVPADKVGITKERI